MIVSAKTLYSQSIHASIVCRTCTCGMFPFIMHMRCIQTSFLHKVLSTRGREDNHTATYLEPTIFHRATAQYLLLRHVPLCRLIIRDVLLGM